MNSQNVVEYALKFCFTQKQLADMLRLQAEANAVMDKAWLKSTVKEIPYYRASFVEAAEAVSHFGYKWWKNTGSDMGQTKMELIDILHFGLSDVIRHCGNAEPEDIATMQVLQSSGQAVFFQEIGRWAGGFDFLDQASCYENVGQIYMHYIFDATVLDNFTFNDICEQLTFASLRDGRTSMGHLYAAFEKLGMTPDEAYGMYVGKNVLNKFRTEHGQLTHDYFKIWDGREDNEHLTEYLETLVAQSELITIPLLEQFLATRYAQVEKREKK